MFQLGNNGEAIRMQPKVQQIMKDIKAKVSTTSAPSKKKWYQKPAFIITLVVLLLVIIGVSVFMAMRNRKAKAASPSFGFYF